MKRLVIIATLVLAGLAWVIPTDALAQRRGGSFGGSRGGGYGRSFRSPSSGRSFGGSRSSRQAVPPRSTPSQRYGSGSNRFSNSPTMRNSFGGARMNRPTEYTGRYGAPRATQRQAVRSANGSTTNYVVNRYGGMGDGFMMGYMLGSIPWYWSMPFHPAFYFSRPYTHVNPDGTVGMYPPTIQWGTVIMTIVIVAGIGFVIYTWLRNRRRRMGGLGYAGGSQNTMAASDDDGSKSSFI